MPATRLGDTIAVLNRLEAEGTIGRYAIAGAVAAFRHIPATLTDDLDLLVTLPSGGEPGLVLIEPIFARLRALGYATFRAEGVEIEGWPVPISAGGKRSRRRISG